MLRWWGLQDPRGDSFQLHHQRLICLFKRENMTAGRQTATGAGREAGWRQVALWRARSSPLKDDSHPGNGAAAREPSPAHAGKGLRVGGRGAPDFHVTNPAPAAHYWESKVLISRFCRLRFFNSYTLRQEGPARKRTDCHRDKGDPSLVPAPASPAHRLITNSSFCLVFAFVPGGSSIPGAVTPTSAWSLPPPGPCLLGGQGLRPEDRR